MLSILIPTYNYDVTDLVKNLYQQCTNLNIVFEIKVYDDASNNPLGNYEINSIKNCSYKMLDKNIGRSAIRNLLAKQASYNWLLFLDADTIPVTNKLIENYLSSISDSSQIIYGGIKYTDIKPKKTELLRWIYGNKREALSVEKRNENKHLSFLTLNFLIHKSVFEIVKFNEEMPNLRCEDVLFSYELQQKNISIEHIENKITHLGLDTTDIFIRKTNESAVSYLYLWKNNLIPYKYTSYGKAYQLLVKTKLKGIVALIFKIFRKSLLNHLKSENPSMFIFDLYRLGYICTLK